MLQVPTLRVMVHTRPTIGRPRPIRRLDRPSWCAAICDGDRQVSNCKRRDTFGAARAAPVSSFLRIYVTGFRAVSQASSFCDYRVLLPPVRFKGCVRHGPVSKRTVVEVSWRGLGRQLQCLLPFLRRWLMLQLGGHAWAIAVGLLLLTRSV